MVTKGNKVFKKFNWSPYFHENKHASNLVKRIKGGSSESDKYQDCLHLICPPPDDLESKQLGDQMEEIWFEELKQRGPAKASLARALFRLLLWDNIEILLWSVFGRLLMAMIMLDSTWKLLTVVLELALDLSLNTEHQPNGSNKSLAYSMDLAESYYSGWIQSPIWYPVLWLFIANCVYQIASMLHKVKLQRCGLKSRVAMTELISRKSVRLHLATSIKESSGRAIGLISNDVTFIETANMTLYNLFVGPLFLLAICGWLAQTQVGWQPVVFTVPVFVAFISIQLVLPKFYNRITKQRKEATNKRIDAIGSFMSSIKMVKMYAWEPKFREKIQELRADELKHIRRLDRFNFVDLVIYTLSDRALSLIIYFSHLLIFKQLAPQLLFITSLAFSLVKLEGILWFPSAVKRLTELLVGTGNVQKYLLLDEFSDNRVRKPREKPGTAKVSLTANNLSVVMDVKKARDNNLAAQKMQSQVFSGLDLDLVSGDRVVVVGAVGTGKSTLLLTLLGETRLSNGHLSYSEDARFAYAPQEPCVFPDSIRNNILNGRPLDLARYQQVIGVCSLAHDLKLMPAGDATMVGPKGVSLSGGQKARLSLARAVYSRADIYLLDDPLSAVDGRVANDIFTDCICNFLADKLVILATHQLQFLKQCNKVVVLERDRKPVFGSTKQLAEEDPTLRQLLADMGDQHKSGCQAHSQTEPRQEKHNEKVGCTEKAAEKAEGPEGRGDKGKGSDYLFVLRCACTIKFLCSLTLVTIVCVGSLTLTDYYQVLWSRNIIELELECDNLANSVGFHQLLDYTLYYLLLVGVSSLLYCTVMYLCRMGLRNALQQMHDLLTESLFKAKMSFYDYCKTGELTSRYAGDFGALDQLFVPFVSMFICTMVLILASLVSMALINPIQLLPIFVSICLSAPIACSNRDKLIKLRDLNRWLQSPIYTSLSLCVDELSTIRSDPNHLAQVQKRLRLEMNRATSVSLLSFSCDARMGLHLKYVSLALLGAMLGLFFNPARGAPHLPTTGAFLMIALNSTSIIPLAMELWFFIETVMISVRNVRVYTELEPEPDYGGKNNGQLPAAKDQRGEVEFKQVTMSYTGKGPALDQLSFSVRSGERVGVVGRTGAGKSSVVSALYRLYPFEGSVEIDGVDTKQVALAELRASLGVIPQDPVLFSDSLRNNLDPFGHFADAELWHALRVVNLAEFVRDKLQFGLDQQMSGGGRNFSAGQRQLVCLARAVLRSPHVIAVDEGSASLDYESDSILQKTIREHFKTSTIITIAHRLNTVLDCDRIMVLEAGRIVEFDTVQRLLALDGGQFKQMLEQSKVVD